MSGRELLFIFVVCSLGVLLFRTKDSYQLVPVWKEVFEVETAAETDSKYPLHNDVL